jgi:DNA-directed RNA polymerase specialized sigma24 family protein
MVEPLRKRHLNGSLYQRRPKVEEELAELEKLTLPQVLACARAGARNQDATVSSEALVYVLRHAVRTGRTQDAGVDGLVSILMERAERTLRRHISDAFDEFQRDEICREVMDGLVDDITDISDRGDYAEVNFNDWLGHNREDACRKALRRASRTERLGDEVDDLGDHDDAQPCVRDESTKLASSAPSPDAEAALAEAREKAPLPHRIEAGEFSPEDQYRIAAAVKHAKLDPKVLDAFLQHYYWGVPIDSKEPNKHTLTKHFGVSEKTVRNWLRRAEEAFAKLRGETDERKTEKRDGPELGAAGIPD